MRARPLVLVLLVAAAVLGGALLVIWQSGTNRFRETFRAGLLALEAGDIARVLVCAGDLDRDPEFAAHARFLKGGVRFERGEFGAALDEFASLQPEGEIREPLFLLTSKCLYQLGRLAESERVLRALVTETPENAEARRWLARIYRDLGAMQMALTELEQFARIKPEDYIPHRLMGLICKEDLLRPTDSVGHYRRALALNPPREQQSAIRRELAECLIDLRDYGGALDVLGRAGESARVLTLTAECYRNRGETELAVNSLDRAQKLDSDDRRALLLRAAIDLAEHRPGAAVAPLQRALDLDPHDYEARYQLALAYRALGEAELAGAEMARMRRSQDLREQLSDLYKQAIRQPDDPVVRGRIAELCRDLEKYELSAVWERAAEACRRKQALRSMAESSSSQAFPRNPQ